MKKVKNPGYQIILSIVNPCKLGLMIDPDSFLRKSQILLFWQICGFLRMNLNIKSISILFM